jgi:hypothetical protein
MELHFTRSATTFPHVHLPLLCIESGAVQSHPERLFGGAADLKWGVRPSPHGAKLNDKMTRPEAWGPRTTRVAWLTGGCASFESSALALDAGPGPRELGGG